MHTGLSDFDLTPTTTKQSYPANRPLSAKADIEAAASLLFKAKQPVMVAGGGALISVAFDEVREIAEYLTMPVATTFTGKGIISEEHPLAIGMLGGIGIGYSEQVVREADVVLLVGFKSGQNSTFGWTFPEQKQQLIHLDLDAAEIGKVFKTQVGITADAQSALRQILNELAKLTDNQPQVKPQYMERLAKLKEGWKQVFGIQ